MSLSHRVSQTKKAIFVRKDALYCKYTNGPILLVNSVQSSRLATPFHGASLVASTMCPECRLKAAPPQSDLSAACTGQPSKNIMGSLFEVGLQCRPAPRKCLDEAPGGAGDASRLLGLLGAGIDCQSTKNKGHAKELYAFVLWAHQGGPCHGAASAALSGLLWRLLQRHPRIRAPWPRPEPARSP